MNKNKNSNLKININLTYQPNPEFKINLSAEIDPVNNWKISNVGLGFWLAKKLNENKENKKTN